MSAGVAEAAVRLWPCIALGRAYSLGRIESRNVRIRIGSSTTVRVSLRADLPCPD